MKEQTGWQLCGDGPAAFERYMVPAFSGAWAQDLVERASLQKGDRVLDVACGTGIVSRHAFASLGMDGQITGVDLNPSVLDKAREICPPEVMPIQWQQCDIRDLPFGDDQFDVALCQQGLQYFPDRSRALKEVYRVLSKEGRAVFSVWRPIDYFPLYTALHSALETFVSAEAAATLAGAFSLGNPMSLRNMFEKAGFTNIEIRLAIKQMRYSPVEEFLVGGFAASPYSNAIFALEESKREEMFATITEAISDYIDDHGLAAPMECWIVSAVKGRLTNI